MNDLQAIVTKDVFDEQSVATSTTVSSDGVDSLGLGDCVFVAIPTSITGDVTEVKAQHSPDDSVWADVPGATLATLPGDADDGKRFAVFVSQASAHDRYLRLSITHGGSGSSVFTADARFANPSVIPTTAAGRGFAAEVIV